MRFGNGNLLELSSAPELPLREQETNLVSRCLEGDSDAWVTMTRMYGSQIGRMVCRHSHLRAEAEDLTQELFLRVYLNLGSFRAASGNLAHWLRRVGRNLIIDHIRRNRRRWTVLATNEIEAMNLPCERIPTPERKCLASESSHSLHQALDLLPAMLKQALVMKYLEEMSYEEMSCKLGLPRGTVKSRVSRARARVTDHLSGKRVC